MNGKRVTSAPLQVRLRGPGVREGRILFKDLAWFGNHLQNAVDRVARVLQGEADSARPGRKPKELRSACALEFVGYQPGSVQIALDLRRDERELPGMDIGERALETMVAGLPKLAEQREALPVGYDKGVLSAWVEASAILQRGVETIEFQLATHSARLGAIYDVAAHQRVLEWMREPISNQRTLEGRLLMADFRESNLKCRLYLTTGGSVLCEFDEALEDAVYDHLRSSVRVTGEAFEDPETKQIKQLRISDIEPLEIETEVGALSADEFWREATLEELAQEQDVLAPHRFQDLVGMGRDLWENEADFEGFVAAIYERRRESREREES